MKKTFFIIILMAAFIFSNDSIAKGKKGLNAVNVKIVCKNGKEYTTTLNKDNTFTLKGVDDDCDGATLELIPQNTDNSRKRPGRVKYSNIVMKRGSTSDNKTKSPLYDDKGRETQNPLYKGKADKSATAIIEYTVSNFSGDLDGDGSPEDVCIEIKKEKDVIKGSFCGNTDHF